MSQSWFAHPTSIIESNQIGDGTRIWAYVHVMPDVVIGSHCVIGDHCFIESGVQIGNNVTIKNATLIFDGVIIQDDAFIGPSVRFTNDRHPRSPRAKWAQQRYQNKSWLVSTVIGKGASIGANATIVCGANIGSFAMVGAGAVVTRPIPDHSLAHGVPARLTGYVCMCGERTYSARPLFELITPITCPNCNAFRQ
jgi:acetyltransferase-like isoleucine patch superfamily enzyme